MLTARFEEAVAYAMVVHGTATRKGSGVPYVSHLLQVAGLALQYGGSENEAIGALLHDAPRAVRACGRRPRAPHPEEQGAAPPTPGALRRPQAADRCKGVASSFVPPPSGGHIRTESCDGTAARSSRSVAGPTAWAGRS